MYTDDSILLVGKYKYIALKNIPRGYMYMLITQIKSVENPELKEYLIANQELITNQHYGLVPWSPSFSFRCDKLTFSTKAAADDFRKRPVRPWKKGKKPIRSYECTRCSGWHVTSKTVEEYEAEVDQHKPKR